MKKIWRQYGRLFIATALIPAINSIFYGYNLLPVLEKKEVLLLIAVTSMVELLLFFLCRSHKVWLCRLQAVGYLVAALLKLAAMMFFKQYGNYDLFSRVRQVSYLSDLVDYILGQLTLPMMGCLGLSLLFFVLLLRQGKAKPKPERRSGAPSEELTPKRNNEMAREQEPEQSRRAVSNEPEPKRNSELAREQEPEQSSGAASNEPEPKRNSELAREQEPEQSRRAVSNEPEPKRNSELAREQEPERRSGAASNEKPGSNRWRVAAALTFFAVWAVLGWQVETLRSLEVYHALAGSAYRAAAGKSGDTVSMTESERQALIFRNYRHQNEYTGIGAGKNLLIIQVESLQDSFIGQSYGGKEITPYLNRLIQKSFYFRDYFELLGFGNSSDAEYVSLQSTFSDTELGAYEDYAGTETMGLPKLAQKAGYQTLSMHGNTGTFYHRQEVHARVGFEQVYMGESYEQDEIIGMGLSDESFFRQSLPRIEEANRAGKFLGFMITLTCHGPFEMPEKNQVFAVEPDLRNTTFARYLNAVYYTDWAIKQFMTELEEKGILQNTVVAIYGDHHAFANADPESRRALERFLGKPFDFDEMMRIPLIVYVPDYEKPVEVEQIGSQIDFMPTMVNLMGWNEMLTPMFGVDLLDQKLSRGNAVFPQTYLLRGSYITDNELFERSRVKEGASGRLIDRHSRERLAEEGASRYYDEANRRIETAQQMYLQNQVMESIRRFTQ